MDQVHHFHLARLIPGRLKIVIDHWFNISIWFFYSKHVCVIFENIIVSSHLDRRQGIWFQFPLSYLVHCIHYTTSASRKVWSYSRMLISYLRYIENGVVRSINHSRYNRNEMIKLTLDGEMYTNSSPFTAAFVWADPPLSMDDDSSWSTFCDDDALLFFFFFAVMVNSMNQTGFIVLLLWCWGGGKGGW